MKKLNKFTALISAIALTCSSGLFVSAEEDAPAEVKVSFNITDDMSPALKTDVSLFEDTVTTTGICSIPKGSFEKDGYEFSGWTVDGIEGFVGGETYLAPEGVEEVVFEPVWYDPKDKNFHDVTYNLDFHGEIIDYPEWLKDISAVAGQMVTPDFTEIQIDGAYTHGLTIMDGYNLVFGGHFIMPAEDVVVTPIWFKRITFTYLAGDVDRLNGSTLQTFPKNEGSFTDLANSDRFSRDGFNLVGWLSDYDGKIYKPLEIVTCPDVDVTFTAVWEPKTYNVVFKQGNGGTNIKVEGKTDTQIICPEPDITVDGKYFAGWKTESGEIYQAGEEYTILGAKPGAGIMLTAVWEKGTAPETTTAVTTSGATETTAVTTTGTTETTVAGDVKTGDANCDGAVNMADVAAIIQHIGNHDTYALTEQGLANAECDGQEGITGNDALAIQMLLANQGENLE